MICMSFLKHNDVRRAREKLEKQKKKKTINLPLLGQLCQCDAKPGHGIFSTSVEVTPGNFSFVGCGPAQKTAGSSTEGSQAEDKSGPSANTNIEQYVRVDKECKMCLVQNHGQLTVVEIDFDDRSTLHVEMDKESIKNIRLANPDRGWFHDDKPNPSLAIISDHFGRFILECKLAGALTSSKGSKQQLTLISTDGTRLTMEMPPGAIKKISYE